jgi:hypothetical protein
MVIANKLNLSNISNNIIDLSDKKVVKEMEKNAPKLPKIDYIDISDEFLAKYKESISKFVDLPDEELNSEKQKKVKIGRIELSENYLKFEELRNLFKEKTKDFPDVTTMNIVNYASSQYGSDLAEILFDQKGEISLLTNESLEIRLKKFDNDINEFYQNGSLTKEAYEALKEKLNEKLSEYQKPD